MNKMDDLQIVDMTVPQQSQSSVAAKKKKKRKAFKAHWAKFPQRWAKAMRRAKSAGAVYELAVAILFKAIECEFTGREIVLSSEMAEMSKRTKIRAAKELVRLRLIKLHRRGGGQAPRVTLLY
jgi:hypothetical protein